MKSFVVLFEILLQLHKQYFEIVNQKKNLLCKQVNEFFNSEYMPYLRKNIELELGTCFCFSSAPISC